MLHDTNSCRAVLAVSKVLNLKANHNQRSDMGYKDYAVLAVSKVLNLKANHNLSVCYVYFSRAVLAVSKVLNLKANHNRDSIEAGALLGCISCIEGTEFES